MAGNIKLEIIYYKTEPDAMLEFGLQGNFAMRILSSRAQNAAEIIAALKKASVRNEFIVVVGGFEDKEVVQVISRAIGREAVPVSQYTEAAQNEEILVPTDAIPLVAENDCLCGAVIESGYQSILLLSGEKQRRDMVLKPLLLPYLTERYKEIHASQFASEPTEQEEILPEQVPPTEIPAEEEILPEEPEMPAEEETLPAEPEVPAEETEPTGTEYVFTGEEASADEEEFLPEIDEWPDFVSDLPVIEEEETPPPKKKKRRVWLILLILFLSLALVAGSAFSYLFYFVPWQNSRKIENFTAMFAEDDTLTALGDVNPDTAGWLNMSGADIVTPVVYADNDSADYYRYHLLDGTINPIGTPYITKDAEPFSGLYIVRMDGYFEKLSQYLDSAFVQNNRRLQLRSVSYLADWQVFSAFTFGKEPAFDYLKADFSDAAEYAKQLLILKNASKIGKEITVEEGDTVALFAATRFGETVVVAARMVFQSEANPAVETVTDPVESVFSEVESIIDSTSSETESTVSQPAVEYKAEDNKIVLTDKEENDDTNLPPLSDAEIKDNLDIPTTPPVSSTVTSSSRPASSTASTVTGPYVTVESNNVNVRSGAGTGYGKLGKASTTATYAYLGAAKDNNGADWYKIQYTAATVGYVSAEYATRHNYTESSSSSASSTVTSSTPSNLVVTVLSNGVNVRSGAGTNYSKLGQVNLGQVFTYLSEKTVSGLAWYSFQYTTDKVGWIRSDFASKSTLDTAPSSSNIALGNVVLTVRNNGVPLQGTALDIVASVIEAEMGSGYPLEALKAQAVATYSFLLVRGAAKGTPVTVPMKDAGTRCYQAAKEVLGQCAYYNGQIAQTYYYAISAGYTANCQDIWSAKIPYLVAVESTPDKSAKGYATEKSFTSEELKAIFNAKYPGKFSFDNLPKEKWFVCTYDSNNAYCKAFLIANCLTIKGNSLCGLLGLRSGAFTLTYNAETDTFTFKVYGHGHGVGLSQVGARGYANEGWDYKKILQHYYPGVVIK
ncbi:MAG: SpoIID/LytB domain-containing protein [Clostridia bacterium]|nr:SpoIID/LytB domain-containing protein [Clostridia bacterium]